MDELITDPLIHFRINTFFNTISEIKRRIFGDGVDNIQQTGLFKDLSLMTQKRMKEFKKDASKIPKAFEVFNNIIGRSVSAWPRQLGSIAAWAPVFLNIYIYLNAVVTCSSS